MASISRPLKSTVPTLPIVAKRIGGGGTSAFSEGVPAAVGPRALSLSLSPRESRGEVHRQRRTHGRATTTERRTNERKSICMIHARERGRLEGGPRGRGTQGWVYTYGERL